MSLQSLPVTALDLEHLQQGIVRVSNPSEAAAFAALINAQSTTVFAYAQALLAQPGHSTEVVDGVISAFDLLTPTAAQFNNLVLNFLPGQIAFAQAHNLNLTVYAAETVGLGFLSNDATFISHYNTAAFANSAGGNQLAAQSIVNAVFGAAATANLNAVALQEITFWQGFYTANPTATGLPSPTADQILVAARATAAGEMVGVAIDGNIGTLKSVADNVAIGDGLHLNSEGPNVLGVTEPGAVPATFLQGQPSQTFLFTVSQDTFVGHGVGDIFSAGLSGPFGDNPTLTDFDSAVELTPNTAASPNHAVLNAAFDGDHTAAGLNLINIPTWNILQHHSDVTVQLFGGPGLFIQGLRTLNYNANGGSGSLEIGTPAFPIVPMPSTTFDGFTILVANAAGSVSGSPHLDIAMASSGFGGGDKIDVTALQVGSGTDFDGRFDIAAGSPDHGFARWDVHSKVGAGNIDTNNIGLGADGSSAAHLFFLTDDGSNTVLWAATATGSTPGDWSNLTTLDLSGTSGDVTVTGGESGKAGFLSAHTGGLTVIGGSGFNLFDLSAFSGPHSSLFMIGGGNAEVELNNTVATASGAFGHWSGVPTLDIVDDGTLGGTVNMLLYPGTDTVQLFNPSSQFDDPDPLQTKDFNFINAPDGFTLNAGGLDQDSFNMFFTGVPGAGNLFVNFGEIDNSFGQFGSTNFDTVNINVHTFGFDGSTGDEFYAGGIFVQANPGQNAVLNIDTDHNLELAGEDTTLFGPDSGGFNFPLNGDNPVGTPTIIITGGTVFDPIAGTLNITGDASVEMGVTNAQVIHDTAGTLEMMAPTSNVDDGVQVDASGSGSVLQGSMNNLVDLENSSNPEDEGGILSGFTGDDFLTGFGGGSDFFGDGGHDTVNLHNGGNTVHFGEFAIDEGENNPGNFLAFTQTISDNHGSVYQGFWNQGNGNPTDPNDADQGSFGSTSADVTVINGFISGSDVLEFNTSAWANNSNDENEFPGAMPSGNLVEGDLASVGNALDALNPQLMDEGETYGEENNFIFLEPGTFGSIANASTLASILHSAIGSINIFASIPAFTDVHVLMAYQNTTGGVNIADVDLFNNTGGFQSNTASVEVRASDMVQLTGVNFSDLVNNASHDIKYVALGGF